MTERKINVLCSLFVISILDLVCIAVGVGLYYGVKHLFLWVTR